MAQETDRLPRYFNGSTIMLHWNPRCGGRRTSLALTTITESEARRMMASTHIRKCLKCQP